jgi:hypothetical protein
MTQGHTIGGMRCRSRVTTPPEDTGETRGLPASRLNLTIGFGPTLVNDGTAGHDRFGIANQRPPVLQDLPSSSGDIIFPAAQRGSSRRYVGARPCGPGPRSHSIVGYRAGSYWQCLHVWEAPVFTERTSVGLDVHARSVVAAAIDGDTGEVFRARLTPGNGLSRHRCG